MIGSILLWWLASTLLGLMAFPLAWRIFNRLPDRGYGMSRALGLLLSGYILWMGASIGFLRNTGGGVIGSLVLLAIVAILFIRDDWRALYQWIKENRKIIIAVEILFFISFLLWSIIRSYNPEIQHTEQPMDLAFLNSILSSETFPPKDPWLSGYAISYYYFGYVLLAFMTRMTGIVASEAFNLGNALWFALTIIGSYSILVNLVSVARKKLQIFSPLLGPLFVVITGNLEILFELLYQRQAFWDQPVTSESTSPFWTWLNLERLVRPPVSTPSWIPDRHWWWWQSSRVIYDENLTGRSIEMIDEFPFFSFLLADNHPHLLALPFVLLAIAFAFNLFRGDFNLSYRLAQVGRNLEVNRIWSVIVIVVILAGFITGTALLISGSGQGEAFKATIRVLLIGGVLGFILGVFGLISVGRFELTLPAKEFWIGSWIFGSLAFLNTWDFPFYLSLLFLVLLWSQWVRKDWDFLKRFFVTAFGLVIAGVLFYLPWYPTFSSQAGGILPNLIFPTRFIQFFIMFGPLVVPIFVWLVRKGVIEHRIEQKRTPLLVAVLLPLGLFILSLLLGLIAYLVIRNDPVISGEVFHHLGVPDLAPGGAFREVMTAAFARRLIGSLTTILLGVMLFIMVGLVLQIKSKINAEREESEHHWIFVIFLVGIGTLLILGPEFVYLKDSFGTRMNTIFKFYYAAWILWGLAAAYATIELWPKRWKGLEPLRSLVILPLLIGLLYPVISVWTKTNQFSSSYGPTLDGVVYREISTPYEYEAIQWINENLESGTIAEAVGNSYTNYARISTHTGLSTVLGWPGHELQWRGGHQEQGSRQGDIASLYTTRSWQEAKSIVDQYGIDYVYIGYLERNSYKPFDERKFSVFMEMVYENNSVIIFATKENGVNP